MGNLQTLKLEYEEYLRNQRGPRGDWRLIFIAERSGLLRRLERHCRRAEIRAGWAHPGSCPAGDGATADLGGDGGDGRCQFSS
jgi:hypothetical protein